MNHQSLPPGFPSTQSRQFVGGIVDLGLKKQFLIEVTVNDNQLVRCILATLHVLHPIATLLYEDEPLLLAQI